MSPAVDLGFLHQMSSSGSKALPLARLWLQFILHWVTLVSHVFGIPLFQLLPVKDYPALISGLL